MPPASTRWRAFTSASVHRAPPDSGASTRLAPRSSAGGEVAGVDGRNARYVGDQQAGSIVGEDTMRCEDHLIHQRCGVQGDSTTAAQCARSCGAAAAPAAANASMAGGCGHRDPSADARYEEPMSNGGPHDPEPSRTDFGALIYRCCPVAFIAATPCWLAVCIPAAVRTAAGPLMRWRSHGRPRTPGGRPTRRTHG
jgi:hypothetical protein